MSFLDKAKQAFGQAKDKAGDLAEQHGDKIDSAIDKGGNLIDKKTGGKYSEKVDKVSSSAKDAAGKLAGNQDSVGGAADATPKADPSAPEPKPTEVTEPIPPAEPIDPASPITPDGSAQ